MAGSKADGAAFAAQAVAAGAAAVVGEKRTAAAAGRRGVRAGRQCAARAGARRGAASIRASRATIAAVTGTSGKTSVAAFTRQIWAALGQSAASIGTIGVVTPKREVYGSLTTPDPVALHRTLDRAGRRRRHASGDRGVVARPRPAPPRRRARRRRRLHQPVARSSRLSPDRRALPGGQAAAVRGAGGRRRRGGDRRRSRARGAVVAAAKARGLEAHHGRAARARASGWSTRRSTASRRSSPSSTPASASRLKLPLVGAFQVENALVAAGLAIATGGEPGAVFAALAQLKGAKGRLDLVGERNGAPIFVDYAHKPDALAKALEALRPYVKRRAGRGVRLRRRPRPGQAAADGRDRGARRPTASSSPTTIRAARIRPRSAPRSCSRARRDRDRRPRARRSAAPSPRCSAATCCWSPARAMKPARSSATGPCRSAIMRRSRRRSRRGGMSARAVDGRRDGRRDGRAARTARCPTASPASRSTRRTIERGRGLLRHQGRRARRP